MGIREDQRLRTRRAILVAAAAEFEARGYQATSYASVAHRAGVAKSLVSYHFAAKTDIVDAVFDVAFRNGVFSATAVDEASPLGELADSTVSVATEERSNPIARAALRLQREAYLIDAEIPPPYVGWIGRCESALARAVALGHVRADLDVAFEAHVLVAQYVGLRDLATALGQYEDLVCRTVVGTLDRCVAMGATPAAMVEATERSVAGMRAADGPGVERVAERLLLPGAGSIVPPESVVPARR
jgi:AcrR family transcriptional regulator